MSILKSTNSGKSCFWKNILEARGYEAFEVKSTIYGEKTPCKYGFKYPFTAQSEDAFALSDEDELIAFISYNMQSHFIKVKDKHQVELIEWYWEAKHNEIFGSESAEKAVELAQEILDYECA